MSKTILVIAEHSDGKLRQVSYEAIQAAKLCARKGDRIHIAILGYQIAELANGISDESIEKIYVIDHPDLEQYNPESYVAGVNQLVELSSPEGIVLGHTAIGRDLAPIISASHDAGQISDVIKIETLENEVLFTRPIYAGKAFETKKFCSTPWVLTIRPNNIDMIEIKNGSSAIEKVEYSNPISLRTTIQQVVRNTSGKIDLSEAKIVVAGGRGVKSQEGFKPLQELADLLGGAVGASRGACDADYCDYSLQIGQTGKVVTPEIYIACGISGAIQHVAGMSQSKVIIAINKDRDAPIFKIADFGIVGDLFTVVPMLTEEFKQVLAKS